MAKIFNGLISYGPTLPADSDSADGALFFKTADTGQAAGLYLFGFNPDVLPGTLGSQVAQGWQSAKGTINLSDTSGILPVSKGGTGNNVAPVGGVAYGTGSQIVFTSAGTSGFVLRANGAAAPTWVDPVTLTTGSTGYAAKAGTVSQNGGPSGTGMTFNYSGLGSQPTGLWGTNDGVSINTYNPSNFSVAFATNATNAVNATNATNATTAGTATNANFATSAGSASTATSATLATKASTLAQNGGNGAAMQFNYAGQSGQPVWLWGTNDGITMQVWQPANFSVANANFATTAGSATTANSATTATTANSATTATTANSANQLTTARNISLSGDASGSVSFNGTLNVNIVTSVSNSAALAGYLPNAGAVVNTIALRDNNGYLFAGYYNQSSSNGENGVVSQIITTNGTDGFFRKVSLAHLATAVGGTFVVKSGDTMTGYLNVPSFGVGAVSAPAAGSMNIAGNITGFGFVSVTGNLVSNSGNVVATNGQVIATNGNVQAGNPAASTGYIRLQGSGSGNSGWLEFWPGNGVRSGYIGATGATGTTDTGGINYVAAFHQFNGNILATGNVTAYSSDGRLKTNVKPIENALDKVLFIGGYSYDWDTVRCAEVGFTPANTHEHGLIAQEVQQVMPDAVAAAPFNDKYLTVRYERIVALLSAAMAEQQRQIEELKARLEALEN